MNFIIRDKGRRKAALWDRTRWQMVEGDSELMSPLPEDGEIEALWRRYFESVAIPERKTAGCSSVSCRSGSAKT